jgi:hypothetical protein
LSAREIADCLARDPRNTRRDIAELKGRGELVVRKDERGVDRYCVTGSTLLRGTAERGGSLRPASAWQPEFPKSPESSSQVIDAEYTDVTDSRLSPLPASYGGVVVHQAAGLTATTRGRSLVPSAPYLAGVLARMFDIDPDGSLLDAWRCIRECDFKIPLNRLDFRSVHPPVNKPLKEIRRQLRHWDTFIKMAKAGSAKIWPPPSACFWMQPSRVSRCGSFLCGAG